MKTILTLFVLTCTFTYSLSQGNYEIKGTAKGISDNTLLYLEFTDENEIILDSALVVAEQFTFKGQLKSNAVYAILKTFNYSNYKFFWMENANMTFKGEKGKFREAVITGSKTQAEQDALIESTKSLPDKQRMVKEKQFIQEQPNSIISAYVLSIYASTWGKDSTAKLFNTFSDELKKTAYGKSISDFIALNKNVKIGDPFVDFSQEDTQNNIIKLSDFKGKVVLLEFWGSWCAPCREANPELVKIYNEFKDKGFEILGVGAETKRETWLKAIEKDKLTWPNVSDLKGDKNVAALIYGVSYYPTNFLIDKTGTIIARDLQGNKLRSKLKELLTQ